jgi:hypothetical protein
MSISSLLTGPELAFPEDVDAWDETETLIAEKVQAVQRNGRKGGPPLRQSLSLDLEDLPRWHLEEGTRS